MIYFDGIHLASPDLEELHSFAARVGIKKCWFEGTRKGHPHYDIVNKNLTKIMGADDGDVYWVSSEELIKECYKRDIPEKV